MARWPDLPMEVEAIARYWAGRDPIVSQAEDGRWTFRSRDPEDGFIFTVTAPGTPFPCFEDSGRPCGDVVREEWCVRAVNDAPDSWWTVEKDGTYVPYGNPPVKIWS